MAQSAVQQRSLSRQAQLAPQLRALCLICYIDIEKLDFLLIKGGITMFKKQFYLVSIVLGIFLILINSAFAADLSDKEWLIKGLKYYELGQYQKAIENYTQAIHLNSNLG